MVRTSKKAMKALRLQELREKQDEVARTRAGASMVESKAERKASRKPLQRQSERSRMAATLERLLDDATADGASDKVRILVQKMVSGDRAGANALVSTRTELTAPLVSAMAMALLSPVIGNYARRCLKRVTHEWVMAMAMRYAQPDIIDPLATLAAWKKANHWPPPAGAVEVARKQIGEWAVDDEARRIVEDLVPLIRALGERRVRRSYSAAPETQLQIRRGGVECSLAVRHGRFPRFTVVAQGVAEKIFDPGTARQVALCVVRNLGSKKSDDVLQINGQPYGQFLGHHVTDAPVPLAVVNPLSRPPWVCQVRPGIAAPLDQLFGSPATVQELDSWLQEVAAVQSAVQLRSGADFARFRGVQLEAKGATQLVASLANTLPPHGPSGEMQRVLAASQTVILAAPLVEGLLGSDDVPTEWVSDIRVPFSIITVAFATWFDLPETLFRLIPDVFENASPDVLGFRRPMSMLRKGGAWLGVTLFAGEEERLMSQALMLMATVNRDRLGQLMVVPATLTGAVMGPFVRLLAAYVSGLRPTRLGSSSAVLRRGRPYSSSRLRGKSVEPAVVVIDRRNVRVDVSDGQRRGRGRVHARRGHWRRVRCGPRNAWHYELRWIPPTIVAGDGIDEGSRIYWVPSRPPRFGVA